MSFTTTLPPTFLASSDPALIDMAAVHDYIAKRSYWGRGIPFTTFETAMRNSLCLGIYDTSCPRTDGGEQKFKQVGAGRWITDCATFAYLSDVYIDDEYQGRGLGKWLVKCLMSMPQIEGLRRLMLITGGAEGLYERYAGFKKVTYEGKYTFMERVFTAAELYGGGEREAVEQQQRAAVVLPN